MSAALCRSDAASPLLAPCAGPQGAFCVPPGVLAGPHPHRLEAGAVPCRGRDDHVSVATP